MNRTTYDRVRDLFLISDPGLFRFRAALRGTVTVLLSVAVLWELSEFGHRPFLLALVGAMIAMNGAMAAEDRTVREQKKTALLLIPLACFGLVLGVVLSPWHDLTLVALLCFTFGAIFIRRYGVRWTNLGGVVYTTFFASIFFRVPQDQMWFVVLGIVIAGLFSYAVKFWVIPDRAQSAIAWSLSAYRAGLRRFVQEARQQLAVSDSKLDREMLRSRMVKVNELALVSEDAIVNAGEALPGSSALVRSLQGKVFDLELSARKIFETFESCPRDETERELAQLVTAFTALRAGEQALVAEEEAAFAVPALKTPQKIRYTPLDSRFDFQTRQAIQATLATAAASFFGAALSTDRWYWAPLTAYIVFTGTTRGDSLRRAFQRLAGTIIGVAAGLLLSEVLQGHRDLEVAALFLTMFLAIFTVKVSYAWYAVFLTTLVAIFYSLLGLLTRDILYLRIEQTLIGGLCGAAAAFLVLPISTRSSLRIELAKLFQLLSDHLNDVVQYQLPRRERRVRVRALERELLTLRAIAGPLRGPFGTPVREETRVVVHGAAALVHFARQLIVFFPEDAKEMGVESMKEASLALSERARRLAMRVESAKFIDLASAVLLGADQADQSFDASPRDHHATTDSISRLAQSISAFETRFPSNS